jgi:hypothetical protein
VLFFRTDKDESMGETVKNLIASNYSAELERVRRLMDSAFANGAASTSRPEDKVVFPLLVSCRDITEEILFAVKEGFGRAALRATRTMYECVVVARHLNLHPEKAADFLSIFHAERAKVYQDIPEARRGVSMDDSIAAYVPKYAQRKRVVAKDLDWSGTRVYEMAKEAGGLAELHPIAYTLASAYIHPGAVFYLSNLSASVDGESVVRVSEGSQETESRYAIRNAHDLLLNAADLRLKYAPTPNLSDLFDECKADFLRLWGYQPHI